nr:MAG TPA: hypothetical protein [Caudoviricetes sp.]
MLKYKLDTCIITLCNSFCKSGNCERRNLLYVKIYF